MINIKFAVETKTGDWFENINTVKECFNYEVKKIYETTFGGIKKMQLLIYINDNNRYCFNFMNGYFSVEALYQLQIYDAKHKILSGRHNEILAEEISILLGQKCHIEIGVSPKTRTKRRILFNRRNSDKTTLKDIINGYHYKEADNIFLEIFTLNGTYMKSVFLYGVDYKWLDYLQTIDYEE